MKRTVMALLLALGVCLGLPIPALAWDIMSIPEPGAADGWVLVQSDSTLIPVESYSYGNYVFDANGRVSSVVGGPDGYGLLTDYTYDDQGRVTSITNHSGTTEDSPVTSTSTYTYRDDGSCVEDGGSEVLSWTSFPDSPVGNDYGYRGMRFGYRGIWNYEMQDGHVAKATRTFEGGSETRTYSHTFDDQGRILTMTGTYTRTGYEPESFPIELIYTYEPDGGHTCKDVYKGGYDLYVFNAKGQLTQFTMHVDGDDMVSFTRNYEYDEYGNNVRIVDPSRTDDINGHRMGVRTYTYQKAPVAVPVPDDPTVDYVYRLYNQWSREHLYTTSSDEANALQGDGWTYESVGWSAPKKSARPIYRLYNQWSHEHFYTTDRGEYDDLCAKGWTGEDVKLYSADETGIPTYRLFNRWEQGPSAHHFTTNADERAQLLSQGWEDEGVCWYGLK